MSEVNDSLQATVRDTTRTNTRIVLASSSPRREQLLTSLGLSFEIMPSSIDEQIDNSLVPGDLVLDLARQKAQDVFKQLIGQRNPQLGLIVLGADTIVVIDGSYLGKPKDKEDAHRMLRKLSGRWHEVYTGVALISIGADNNTALKMLRSCERSRVLFRELADEEITAYVETGEPMDKAGAYALQGIGSALVESLEGSYTNIVGLPIPNVVLLLREAGYKILGLP